MKPSKNNSSPSTARAPYQPVRQLIEVPFALYEIFELATRGNAAGIVPLIQSVIEITQAEPDGLTRLPRMAKEAQGEQ